MSEELLCPGSHDKPVSKSAFPADYRRPLPSTYLEIDRSCVILSLRRMLKLERDHLALEGTSRPSADSDMYLDLSRLAAAWITFQSAYLSKLFSISPIVVGKEPYEDSDSDCDSDFVGDDLSDFIGSQSLEVISVVIKKNNKTHSHIGGVVSLYGQISVNYGRVPHEVLYRKDKTHPESISLVHGGRTSDTLLLAGPSPYLISALDAVNIYVELMAKVELDNLPMGKDVVISKGQISWNSFTGTATVYEELEGEKFVETGRPDFKTYYYPPGTEYFDKILAANIGSATVEYIIFSDAVNATLVVTLLGKNNKPALVYGNIDAVGVCGSKIYKIVLFNKKKNDDDKNIDPVRPGETICLSRSILAIGQEHPLLLVSANLYDEDNVCIAKGDTSFPRAASGGDQEKIFGTSPWSIEVKVTWSPA